MKSADSIRTAYGADLSPGRLVVARCKKTGRDVSCETLYAGAPPLDGDALNRLRSEDARLDVAVAGALSAQVAFVRWVHTPLNSVEKSLRVFASLLDVQIPFAVEQCEVAAAQVRREDNGAISVLAVACRRDDLRQIVAEYEAAGMAPDILDHEGLALWSQSFREVARVTGGPRVVALVRPRHVTLAVGGGRPDGILAVQRLRMGADDFGDPVRGAQACRDFAVKVRQLLLVHVADRLEPGSVTWFWCGEAGSQVLKALESELRIVGPPNFITHEEPEWFLARALATRAVQGESWSCNLLKGRLTPAKQIRRVERRHRRAAAWMMAAGLSLLLSAAALRWGLAMENRALETVIAETARTLTGLTRVPRGQEILVTRRMLEEHENEDAVLRRCARDELGAQLAAWLDLCEARRVEIEWMGLSDETLLARGTFKDWNDGEAVVQWLESEGYRANLSRKEAGAAGRVPFSLKAVREISPGGGL